MALLFFQIILALLIFLGIIALVFLIIGKYIVHVPFVPVPRSTIPDILHRFDFSEKSVLYDLGSGDGRLILSALKSNNKIRGVGIEKAPLPYFLSQIRRAFSSERSRIRFLSEDFFKSDLSSATHIFLYLFPEFMDKLLPKITNECGEGTHIISCDFPFSSLSPKEVISLYGNGKAKWRKLYVYEL
jgi:hypothetical protein